MGLSYVDASYIVCEQIQPCKNLEKVQAKLGQQTRYYKTIFQEMFEAEYYKKKTHLLRDSA